jgi:uncharacterized membrane protein
VSYSPRHLAAVETGLAGRSTLDARRFVAAGQAVLPYLPVAALIVAYVLRFSLLSVQVYDGYGAPGFDMAIPDQGVWLLSRFHVPFSTVMGRDFFADHTSFVFLLAVPLYWLYPRAQTLLVLQSCLLAAAAIPIFLLARRRVGGAALPTLLAAAYLLNPALQNGNLEQVHVEGFTVFFLSLAIYAAVESKGRLLALSAIGLLLCKEDTALFVVPLALWVFWRRNRKWGVRLFAGAVAAAAAESGFIYAVLGQLTAHGGRLPFGGLGGTIRNALLHPGRVYAFLRSGGRPFYVWQMVSSAGLVFLLAPEIAALGALALAVNLLSTFGYEHQIIYHYSLPLVPVLAMAAVFAVATLSTPARRYLATGLVVAVAFTSCVFWGLAPFSRQVYPHSNPNTPQVQAINEVLRLVPAHAVVSAYYPYVAHLDHRTRIYEWPTPFHAAYWALYHQEGQRLPFANQVQYLVLPVDLSLADRETMAAIANQYALIGEAGGVDVYQRIVDKGVAGGSRIRRPPGSG